MALRETHKYKLFILEKTTTKQVESGKFWEFGDNL